jgi:hypothetical protein
MENVSRKAVQGLPERQGLVNVFNKGRDEKLDDPSLACLDLRSHRHI